MKRKLFKIGFKYLLILVGYVCVPNQGTAFCSIPVLVAHDTLQTASQLLPLSMLASLMFLADWYHLELQ